MEQRDDAEERLVAGEPRVFDARFRTSDCKLFCVRQTPLGSPLVPLV